ncbi:MAG: TrkH family potassium uptake protein [Candidatus Omnitrophota bacterium]
MKNQKSIFNHKQPEALIVYNFLLAIVIGSFLLKLPIASTKNALSWLDSFFMSTSAVCVTGLSVTDIGKDLTLFGQMVILFLIQIGGLGVMIFSLLFLILIGKKIALLSNLSIPHLSQDISFKNIKYSIFMIFIMTFFIESAGAILLFCNLKNYHPFIFAVYSSIFHSVSAFCNAGFSLYADNFIGFNNNPYVMLILMFLIVLGGLGFIVIYEAVRIILFKRSISKKISISLHTKIALTGSLFFIVFGAVIIWLLESQGILRSMPLSYKILNSFFLSITSRTAGFNSVNTSLLSNPTLILLLFLMFVGGCPGSTAGGIKIHTFFSVIALMRNKLRGLTMTSLFNRKIPDAVVGRALTIFLAAIFIIFIAVFLLQLTENVTIPHLEVNQKEAFLDTLFEVISAFGTVGLSTGTTLYLSSWGKGIIILLMFVGRIGLLTLGIALQMRQKRKLIYEFPVEEIIVS